MEYVLLEVLPIPECVRPESGVGLGSLGQEDCNRSRATKFTSTAV